MASRRVPLNREEIAQLQGGTKPIFIIGLVGVLFIMAGIAMLAFELFDSIIAILPFFPGVGLIGFAIKSYFDLKKNLNYSYKDVVCGTIEKMEIRYPSMVSTTKITYEFIGADQVKVTEVGFNSNKTSAFSIDTDYWLRKVTYNFYVTLDANEYKIGGRDFFALKIGDPLELEVLPSREVLKLNRSAKN